MKNKKLFVINIVTLLMFIIVVGIGINKQKLPKISFTDGLISGNQFVSANDQLQGKEVVLKKNHTRLKPSKITLDFIEENKETMEMVEVGEDEEQTTKEPLNISPAKSLKHKNDSYNSFNKKSVHKPKKNKYPTQGKGSNSGQTQQGELEQGSKQESEKDPDKNPGQIPDQKPEDDEEHKPKPDPDPDPNPNPNPSPNPSPNPNPDPDPNPDPNPDHTPGQMPDSD